MRLNLSRLLGLVWSAGVPLLWLLGIEQAVWPALSIGLLLLLGAHSRVVFSRALLPVIWAALLFLAAMLASGVQVREGHRLLSFSRDLSVYASALMVFMLAAEAARREQFALRLLWHLSAFVLLMNVAVLSYILIGPWELTSVVSSVLPGSIRATPTGARMVTKAVAGDLYFLGLTSVRARGWFSSGIQYGAAMVLLLPVLWWGVKATGRNNRLVLAALVTTLVCFPFSQSRTALVVFVLLPFLAWVASNLLDGRFRAILKLVAGGASLLAGMAVVVLSILPNVIDLVRTLFVEVRAGSFLARVEVYRLTLEGILERPLTGWGTQRDLPGLRYPIGSHNWPLGVAYKYGAIGLFAASLTLGATLRRLFGGRTGLPEDALWAGFRKAVCVGTLGYLLISLTLEPIVDAIGLHLFAVLVGAAVGGNLTNRPFATIHGATERGWSVST